jgi:RNA polymerase sigma factor (sigma-70 family)
MPKESERPLLEYFASLCDPLSRQDAQAADFSRRIASIGRFLVREALRFYRQLSPEGKVTFDPEDLLLEMWIELSERDRKYDSSKSSYLCFAQTIIRNRMAELFERSRCVKLQANTAGTFKAAAAGIEVARENLENLLRAARDHEEINGLYVDETELDPLELMIRKEEAEESNEVIGKFLQKLDLHECLALGCNLGMYGEEKTALKFKAAEYGLDEMLLRRSLATAKEKLQDFAYKGGFNRD